MTTAGSSTMQQSKELTDLTNRFYQAAGAGDTAAFERLISREDGMLFIGTDPKEWWIGYDAINRAFRAQKAEMGGGLPLVAGNPVAYAQGDVGWVVDRPKFKLPDGEVGLRLTMVAHQEEGEWKIVQGHISIGVSNEEALGQELTV
jgi:ketosteroid isomerase-like protein